MNGRKGSSLGQVSFPALSHDILQFPARVLAILADQVDLTMRSLAPRATVTMMEAWPPQLARSAVTITAYAN